MSGTGGNKGVKIIIVLALLAAAYFFLPIGSLLNRSDSTLASIGNRLGGNRGAAEEEPEEPEEEEIVSEPEPEPTPEPEPEPEPEPPETAEVHRRRQLGIQSFGPGGFTNTGEQTRETLPETGTEPPEVDPGNTPEEG